jgi:type I restriction enzyme S subunit
MSNGDLSWIANFNIKEFHTRLVANVLTGKTDIRSAAASLPQIIEADPIDELAEGNGLDEAIEDVEDEEVAA